MSEVTDGKAAGARGCREVVSGVGEEDGEEGFEAVRLSASIFYTGVLSVLVYSSSSINCGTPAFGGFSVA